MAKRRFDGHILLWLGLASVRVFESLTRDLLVGEFDHLGGGVVHLQGGVVDGEARLAGVLGSLWLGTDLLRSY